MIITSNKAFHHYGAQGAPRVNADVGSKEMKYAIPILCLMMATAIRPMSANATETNAAPLPSSTERIWTIEGRQYRDLIYLGPQEKDGNIYAVFAKNGLGPQLIPLDKLSPVDIEIIKQYDHFLESKKNNKKTQQGGPGYPPQGVGSPDP